ncbi:MAG: Gfo/Idh/MocA family protein [Planctomycetota bacterium]|jgi:hypothetical protein
MPDEFPDIHTRQVRNSCITGPSRISSIPVFITKRATAIFSIITGDDYEIVKSSRVYERHCGRRCDVCGVLTTQGARSEREGCDRRDARRFARAREAVEEAQNRRPKLVQDFRRVLDDRNVDVLVNATPDHWHALGSIMACQAGKDVYVEKPMAHNIREGRKMIEAARKYKRVIQVGMQSRSVYSIRQDG